MGIEGRSFLLAMALLTAGSGTAGAYVQTKLTTGEPVSWPNGCVPLTVHLDDFPGIPAEEVRAAVTAAAAAWSGPSIACSGVTLPLTFAAGQGPPPGVDRLNVIGARRDLWCELPNGSARCLDPTAVAVTDVASRKADAKMIDADIQLNVARFSWTTDEAAVTAGVKDLQAALTRQIGLLLGFSPPCLQGRAATASDIDDRGAPLPSCQDATAEMRASVLFPGEPADASRRVLSAEDQRGVCAVYASAPAMCPVMDSGGCAVGGGQPGPFALLGLALALCLLARRRR